MEQASDEKKPPPTSYRQTFRRHRKLLSVPMILGAVVAAFFAMHHTKTYSSSASLWVDTTPPVPSSVGASTGPTSAPPAASEQGILSELLTTDAFAASVAKSSLLGKYLGSSGTNRAGAAALLAPANIVSNVAGPQVLSIKYTGPSPAVTESVLGAIVAQLRDYNSGLTAQHDQAAVAYDKEQVRIAQQTLATARHAVDAYLAQHPNANQQDPNYASLVAAQSTANTQLGQANTTLSQATGTRSAGGWMIQVIDPPSPATTVAYGKKKMLEVILGGVFGGLLVSFLAVVALTPTKRDGWEDELPVGKPIVPDDLPIGSLPNGVHGNGRELFVPKRRFTLTPSDKGEER